MDYYTNKHGPMVGGLLGDALKGVVVEEGISGGEPGTAAPYAAIGHLMFDSIDDFQNAFGPNAEQIMGDIPNYTNSSPVIQISEIKVWQA